MGWTYTHVDNPSARKENVDNIFRNDLGENFDLVRSAIKNGTWYGAVRDKVTGETKAWVTLIHTASKDWYNFGYKDLPETMGPCCHDCPESILDILTPTDDMWAREWREHCRRRIQTDRQVRQTFKNLPVGTRFTVRTNRGKLFNVVKAAPAYQFRTPWLMTVDSMGYVSLSHVNEIVSIS